MVDTPTTPTTPLTQQQVDMANQYAEAYSAIGANAGTASTVLTNLGGVLGKLDDALARQQISLNNLSTLNDQQIQDLTLITSGFIKARESFVGFANVDTSGLSTFSDQMKDLREALFSGGTAASEAAKAIEQHAKALFGDARARDIISEGMKKGQAMSESLLSAIEKEGAGVMTHADNMLRLQNAYVQMAATTGNLGDVWSVAGKDLQNINDVLGQQTELIGDSIEATGLSGKQVEDYYSQLGQIPGALEASVAASGKAGSSTSMLTAAIQVATGTGRKYTDVMTDLKVAFKDYGLVGEDALKFSTRMSDVSTRLKAPIEDVTNALRGSADAFKMFATGQKSAEESVESLSGVMNKYGKALESTGLSASQSIDVVSQLTSQVSRMTLGQQAFISQQSGGPGGLMGAARQQLKTPGEQVEDAMSTLKKQFGQIMTVKDAAQSEAAASQWVKQTAMLQQLLGPLAKDQQSANRLLEAMKNRGEKNPGAIAKALAPTSVQDAEDRGQKLQEGQFSEMSKSRAHLERLRYLADQGSIRMFQTGMTARAPISAAPTEAQTTMRAGLQQSMQQATLRGGAQTHEMRTALQTGSVAPEAAGVHAAEVLQRTASTIAGFPTSMKSVFDTIKGVLSSPDADSVKSSEDMLESLKADRLGMAKQLEGNPKAQAQAMAEATAAQRMSEMVRAAAGQGSKSTQVGDAARANAAAAARLPGETAANQPGTSTHQGPGAQQTGAPQTINIVGKFSIDCPHCGRPSDVSPQARITPQQFNQ
jgi:hypothetical protein